ncbi:hypothetical protein J6X15_02870 [Candidatus Saccharibacteria bacterium]|nr:hypothetical protein [Candidatus Saccharibacteria bacterium]
MRTGEFRSNVEEEHGVDASILHQQVGAKLLTLAGARVGLAPELKQAEKRFAKDRKAVTGEAVAQPDKESERATIVHLDALQKIIDSGGSEAEQNILDDIIDGNDLGPGLRIVEMSDIPDSYWKLQEEILRDNGQGRRLSEEEKRALLERIQTDQRDSLERWRDYMERPDCPPYPTWFKLYALDGMSKMSTFDKEKKKFRSRDKSTVAPYPNLDTGALARVYQRIADFYGLETEGFGAEYESEKQDAELVALIRSGNFNQLYSKALLETHAKISTPERMEDVRGEWQEYLPGEEDRLAEAAAGTPWCIQSASVGREYLGDPSDDNKARFLLFHLQDPTTGVVSDAASASIRFNTQGNVAEISGLNEGQALEDSLVPIVEEKVRTFPGGEQFLEAFADKKHLIEIDHKWRKGGLLDDNDRAFLSGRIKTLDTYNNRDPRIFELNQIAIPLQEGKSIEEIVAGIDSDHEIMTHMDTLVECGADITELALKLSNDALEDAMDDLVKRGADYGRLAMKMGPAYTARRLDKIFESGSSVDVDALVDRMHPVEIVNRYNDLIKYKTDINLNEVASKMTPSDIMRDLEFFTEHGVEIDFQKVASGLNANEVLRYYKVLAEHNVAIDVNELVLDLRPQSVSREGAEILLECDVDADILASKMMNSVLSLYVDELLEKGATADDLVPRLSTIDLSGDMKTLLEHGADANKIVSRFEGNSFSMSRKIDLLMQYGASIDNIVAVLEQRFRDRYLDKLRGYGAKL